MYRLIILKISIIILGLVLLSTQVNAESEPVKTYQRWVNAENYHLFEEKGIIMIIRLMNPTTSDVSGNMHIQIRRNPRSVSFPISNIKFVIKEENSLRTWIPIAKSSSGSQAEAYSFAVSLVDMEFSRLEMYFEFPGDYEKQRYYYAIKVRDLADIGAQSDQKLRNALIEFDQVQ